jgi:hypothetical protein
VGWKRWKESETNREGKEGRRTNEIHFFKSHSLTLCNAFEYANEIQEWDGRGERRVRRTGKGRKDAGPTEFITTRPTPSHFVTIRICKWDTRVGWKRWKEGETNREGKEGRRTNEIHFFKSHSLTLCNGFEYANEIQEWDGRGERRVKQTGKGRKDAWPTKFITTRPTPSHFVTDSNMQMRYKSGMEEEKGGCDEQGREGRTQDQQKSL